MFIAGVLCDFYALYKLVVDTVHALFTLKGLKGMLCIKDLDIRNVHV